MPLRTYPLVPSSARERVKTLEGKVPGAKVSRHSQDSRRKLRLPRESGTDACRDRLEDETVDVAVRVKRAAIGHLVRQGISHESSAWEREGQRDGGAGRGVYQETEEAVGEPVRCAATR